MKNSTYWEERQASNYKAREKEILSFYKDLERSFIKAKREIQNVIDNFYIRYADNNNISYTMAQKALTKQEIGELNDFIKKVYATMGTRDKDVVNISLKARITRYEALMKQLEAITDNLYTIQYENKGKDKLKDVFMNSYNRTWYNIDIYNGFHKEFAQVDVRTIEELIKYPFNGANYSSRIWKQKDHMISKLKENITMMIVQGKNPKTLSKDFSKIFNTKEYEAYRLLHTEGSFIIEQGTLAAYKEDGVEKYQVLATLDLKTSEICREQDNKIYDISKYVTGSTAPPFHHFCRTTTAPYYGDDKGTRVARNEAGKSHEVPSNMSYDEWYKKYVENNPRALLAEKKLKNRSSDKEQYERYKKVLKSDSPKSFNEFQNIKYNDKEKWDRLKQTVKQTGGKYTRGDISWYNRREEEAEEYYSLVRKMKNDISKISKNTGFSEKVITRVKNHVFYDDKHVLYGGRIGLLDADYDMSVAWQRLINGAYEERDILLLKHEYLESRIEKRYNLTNKEAHDITIRKYDWYKKLREEKGELGEDDCLNEIIRKE